MPATGPSAESSAAVKSRYDVGTKSAPVDGKDGKPHDGPFVDFERTKPSDDVDVKDRPPLKGRPEDPHHHRRQEDPRGQRRRHGRQGPPAAQAGHHGHRGRRVGEGTRARKAKEGETGERAMTKPETPKAAPPLPHSEEEKMLGDKDSRKETTKTDSKSSDSVGGLEVSSIATHPPKITR